ncbi:MAG: AbiH family protein [Bacteroidota bacterium]|nr:AbiH family protein [Bacteroidota bacterium]
MNRIILIGNGFDLAHGLPTQYADFIKDYWDGFIKHCLLQDRCNVSGNYNYDCIKFKTPPGSGLTLSYLLQQNHNATEIQYIDKTFKNCNHFISFDNQIKCEVGNKLLRHLFHISNDRENNWVDIENEYYQYLTHRFKRLIDIENEYYSEIRALNIDFNHIKELLSKYLSTIIESQNVKQIRQIRQIIYSQFDLKDFIEDAQHEFIEKEYNKILEYQDKNNNPEDLSIATKTKEWIDSSWNPYEDGREKVKCNLLDIKSSKKHFELQPEQILFLSFNYTDIEKIYRKNKVKQEIIHIHGELGNPKNPIIFGYGDELEENYSKLENLQDNDYLENIKSIRYLETDNYKKMLSFIDSDKYQVIIMGHSCGNSDRTLLNTLFEHKNCVSIKPYYYKYKDQQTGEIKDNYSDIVRNISRSFTNKKSMRDKVVNKIYTDWFSRNID